MKQLRNIMNTLAAVLREVFDESAYARFLVRTKAARSRESYAKFLREIECRKHSAPRCC